MEELGYLILLCGLVFLPGSFEENLAFKGTVTQSSKDSTDSTCIPENAVDGTRYGSTLTYCSITQSELNPWWRLDLLDYYGIGTVTITARSDNYLSETNGAEIHIGNSLANNGNNNPICAVVSGLPSRGTGSYSCNGMEGRYVNVVITGRVSWLTLCEVEVFESENLALKGTATQPSTYSSFVAPNAINGLRFASPCSITAMDYNQWWRLDLLDNYDVGTVIITARSDCCVDETNGAEIRIGNSLENNGNNNPRCDVVSGLPLGGTGSYSCNGMDGRYVNIIIIGRLTHLSLCEVEVYGKRHRIKNLLRLTFFSSVDVAAVSNEILNKLQSALALRFSDFTLSWTQLPQQEVKYEEKRSACV